MINIISQVQSAYWDLVYARKNLEVQKDAVKQARAQLESNKHQVEAGTLAPLDVVSAETQVTNFEQNVYTAQEAVTTAENTLKTLLLPDRKDEVWSQPLLPVTPVNVTAPRVPLGTAEARLKAASASRASAEKQYEGEQLKFQTGVSTVFLVLERQQELVAARGNELQAQTTLTKAIAAYEKVVSSTLQVNHVNVRAE